jgi:hypothetical protein
MGAHMGPKPHERRHVCVPVPSAKGGGICVLQGAHSRCTRLAVASRTTLESSREPTEPADRSPRAHVETFRASPSSRFFADCGVLWTGVEPVTPRLSAWCSTL